MKRFALLILSAFVLYVATILFMGWRGDWQPEERITLTIDQAAANKERIHIDSTLTFLLWNVGYGGLGRESDFFFDDEGMYYSGSSMIHAPKNLVEKNIAGQVAFLKQNDADFYLLQEVDRLSDRSHHIPQYDFFRDSKADYAATMAENYRCERVPIPIFEPWHFYGEVLSGLATLSAVQPDEAVRYQLPGQYPMPDRIFQLDRCAALHRFVLEGSDKQLIVINVHNSAYDPGDKIKAIQMPYLRQLAVSEYERGNYVVLGGDWNQCPPNFRFDAFMPGKSAGYEQGNIPDGFFPEDWVWAYDPTIPTNRKCRDPYQKGETFETLIDFFLVSPNVQVAAVKGEQLNFEYSDHQPVAMKVTLKK